MDGTYNFLSGLPYWCSALALASATAPARGCRCWARSTTRSPTSCGWAGWTSRPAATDSRSGRLVDIPLSRLSVGSYLHPTTLPDDGAREPLLAMLRGAATVRMLGSGSLELAAVAGGRLGIWAQLDTLDWDWLPGAALVNAAGGVTEVLHHRGHRWHLAGNRQAVAEARALLLS